MNFVFTVAIIAFAIAAFIKYSPEIETWNEKHLLSRGKK